MERKLLKILFYVIVALYAVAMADLLLRFNAMFDADRHITRSYNFVPFRSIWAYVSGANHVSTPLIINNVLGNIAIFVPFGLFLQMARKRKTFAKSLLIVCVATLAVEATQLAFGLGACDIDDIILNALGGAAGILGYGLLSRVCKGEGRANTVVMLVSLVGGLPMLFFYFNTLFFHWR